MDVHEANGGTIQRRGPEWFRRITFGVLWASNGRTQHAPTVRIGLVVEDSTAPPFPGVHAHRDVKVRVAAASSLHTSGESLGRLADDNDDAVRRAVASNVAAPAALLAQMATSSDPFTCSLVAANPSTAGDTLVALADHASSMVRDAVAANRATPVDALTLLSADTDGFVRCALAFNENTPASVLNALASDPDWMLRFYLACNPSTGAATLATLVDTPCGDDHTGGSATPLRICTVFLNVSRHSETSPETLHKLAQIPVDEGWHPLLGVRESIAAHPAATALTMRALCKGRFSNVLLAVAKSARCSSSLVYVLAAGDRMTKAAAAANPSLGPDNAAALASSPLVTVREALAANPCTAPETLRIFVCDVEPTVRVAAAKNPHTPVDDIDIVRDDAHDCVSDAAVTAWGAAMASSAAVPSL